MIMLAELFTFVAAADTCIVAIPKDFDHSLLIEHIRTIYDFHKPFGEGLEITEV
jgi:hypothetical protein